MRVTSATAILALASSALAANYSCPAGKLGLCACLALRTFRSAARADNRPTRAGSLNGTQFNNQSYAATPSQVLSIVGNFIGK